MILVFDTKTTGKADFRASFTAEHQPHLVQLGAQLLDNDYKVRGELNLLIKPAGWQISPEASAVHGITDEIANNYGVDLSDALQAFALFAIRSKVLVAHNFDFDSLILSAEWFRQNGDGDQWLDGDQVRFCTMQRMTPICNLPGPYGPKWPKLQEAYQYCFKEELQGAHDAMADVRACARLYQWLMAQQKPAPVAVTAGGA